MGIGQYLKNNILFWSNICPINMQLNQNVQEVNKCNSNEQICSLALNIGDASKNLHHPIPTTYHGLHPVL